MGKYDIRGLLDPRTSMWRQQLLGITVLGDDSMLPELLLQGIRDVFIGVGGVGDNSLRRQLYEKVIQLGFQIATPIHPNAIIAASSEVGMGSAVLACAVINASARLGKNVIVNTGAIVEHDCVVEDHAHLATGCRLASNVFVGVGSHIGVGACVRQYMRIGRNAVVGAGAVVVKDVPEIAVVVGVPARVIKWL